MKFRIKRLFSLISLSIIGLILASNLIVNAQAPILAQNNPNPCSILPSAVITIKDKDGKDIKNEKSIPLQLINVQKDVSSSSEIREISLGDRIRVTVEGLTNAIEDKDIQYNPQQLVLQLNGYPIKGLNGTHIVKDQLIFQLTHQEASRDSWNAILGGAWNGRRDVELSVGCPDGQKIQIAPDAKNSKKNMITIILWESFRMLIILFPLVLLVFFLFTKELKDALRGSGISKNRVYSLGRFQIAWWSYLIFLTFLGMFAITGGYTNIITTQSMVLLGVSSATAIGSSIIDSSEGRQLTPSQIAYLKNLEHRLNFLNLIGKQDNKQIDQELIEFELQVAEINALVTPGNPRNSEQIKKIEIDRYKDLLNGLKNKQNLGASTTGEIANIEEAINGLEQQHTNFLQDILTNPSGEINLHRYQIFIWTIVLGLIFIYQVLITFKMPEFDSTLLALQGISSGTFLALKAQEKPANA
jgi:hypothetical protein